MVAAPWMVDVSQAIADKLMNALQQDSAMLADDTAKGALARGRVFGLAAYHDAAIDSFKEALELDPDLHEAAARLVVHLTRLQRREEALEAARKLVEMAPDFVLYEMTSDENISAFTLLGNSLLLNGFTDEATEAYQEALRVSVSETTASARLAQVYIATGKDDAALDLADAFTSNPRFIELSNVLRLARDGQAQLPTIELSHVQLDVHGRPLTVDGDARLAPVVQGDTSWCADVLDVLPGDARS